MTTALYVAGDPPSLDEEIVCHSDRWSRASSAPWTIDQMAAALWGRSGGRDREAFREEVRAAVDRLVERGRVKAANVC